MGHFPFKKKKSLKHWILPNDKFKANLFFHILDGGTLFSLDPVLMGGSNFNPNYPWVFSKQLILGGA